MCDDSASSKGSLAVKAASELAWRAETKREEIDEMEELNRHMTMQERFLQCKIDQLTKLCKAKNVDDSERFRKAASINAQTYNEWFASEGGSSAGSVNSLTPDAQGGSTQEGSSEAAAEEEGKNVGSNSGGQQDNEIEGEDERESSDAEAEEDEDAVEESEDGEVNEAREALQLTHSQRNCTGYMWLSQRRLKSGEKRYEAKKPACLQPKRSKLNPCQKRTSTSLGSFSTAEEASRAVAQALNNAYGAPHPPDREPDDSEGNSQTLSAYEHHRLDAIGRNQAKLQELGLA